MKRKTELKWVKGMVKWFTSSVVVKDVQEIRIFFFIGYNGLYGSENINSFITEVPFI